jgi:hypothetical protein
MISALFSSFGSGSSGTSVLMPSAAQSPEIAKTAPLAAAEPHVAAALNASIARTTIQAILESSQSQKSALRSGCAEEGDFKTVNRRISRAAGEYDEAAENDEDDTEGPGRGR